MDCFKNRGFENDGFENGWFLCRDISILVYAYILMCSFKNYGFESEGFETGGCGNGVFGVAWFFRRRFRGLATDTLGTS